MAIKRSNKIIKKLDDKLCKECKKREREKKISIVMEEFKDKKLRSGSKKGPVVKNKRQAIAIALSEAGASKRKTKKKKKK